MARRGENIYKRKDGRYEGRFIKSYDISGKAVYGYVYAKSYTEVKKRLLEHKTSIQDKRPNADISLCDWLDRWLNAQTSLKETSIRIYRNHIKNHINPAIGPVPLKELTSESLRHFINGIPLASSTVSVIFSVLKSALSEAGRKGFISDIWSGIKFPRKEKIIVPVLTVKEQRMLERTLVQEEDIGILICLYTGLRIGELCALKWSDIQFENGVLTVNGTQVRTEHGVKIVPPKSRMSRREIPLPLFLQNKLKALPQKGEFVINRSGKPFDTRTYRRRFKAVLKRAGLQDIRFHSLRHTFATRALEVGMDFKTLSEILGHASVAITLDLYAHSLKEYKRQQMNKLDQFFYL